MLTPQPIPIYQHLSNILNKSFAANNIRYGRAGQRQLLQHQTNLDTLPKSFAQLSGNLPCNTYEKAMSSAMM
jgi:hypothetical protein